MHSFPAAPPHQRLVITLASALLAAALAWWLVGDLSYTGDTEGQGLDRIAQPPISEVAARGLGGLSVVLLPLVLLAGWRSWAVLLPAVVLGAVLAAAGRVVTAGVIGANIGGGMVLLFAPLVLLPLGGWLAAAWSSPSTGNRSESPQDGSRGLTPGGLGDHR